MDEENERNDATDRQRHRERHSQARDKFAIAAAANGTQYDQAVDENAGEYSEHDLCYAITYKIPQDA